MNIDKLKKEKQQLEVQRDQAIATVNQITGAISMLNKLIEDLEESNNKDKEESKE